MTEDEAFIRAIVDSPGDDTPRLVCADWLDDRTDPRGPFLRAEIEWAKPWRAGEQPVDSRQLGALTAGLDPVWVARVSRPPVGVCCEHVTFLDRGHVLTAAEVDTTERRLNVTLPADYRAFLLNYNGGRPDPDVFLAPGRDGEVWEVATVFGGVNPEGRLHERANWKSDLVTATMTFNGNDREPQYLPVVFADILKAVGIGLTPRRRGKVYLFNRDTLTQALPPRKVCDSFAGLLARFRRREATQTGWLWATPDSPS